MAPLFRLSPVVVYSISRSLAVVLIPFRRKYPRQGLGAGQPIFEEMRRGCLAFTLGVHSVPHLHPFHFTYARMTVCSSCHYSLCRESFSLTREKARKKKESRSRTIFRRSLVVLKQVRCPATNQKGRKAQEDSSKVALPDSKSISLGLNRRFVFI